FAFEALEPARYHATFTGVDGGVERFTARTDEPSSRPFAPIPAHPRVPVRFEDADGAPLANVRILLRTDASRFEVTTGRDGVARIPKAPSQVLRFYRRDDRGDVVSSTELLADELDGDPTVVRTPLEALDVVIEGPVGVEFMNRLCVATRHGGRVWTEEVRPEAGQDRRRPRRAVVRGARAGDLVVMEGRGVAVGVLEPVRQGAAEILTVKAPHARPRPQTSIGSGAFTRIAGRPWPSALRFASLRIDERTSVYVPERPAGATDTAPSCAAEFTVARPDGREPKVCFGW
ncbi:MAG TPA: hypothetical protein VEI02_08785, partial [Planctomycetota bacterium]|nr:hypothetical protein [Planctomycetota bacterium]